MAKRERVTKIRFALVFFPVLALLFCFSTCDKINEILPLSGLTASEQENLGPMAISPKDPYYVSGTKEEKDNLENFFALLASESEHYPTEVNRTEASREQFAVVREIANTYVKQKEYGKLINFLGSRIYQNPEDIYNAYYLLMIAFAYQQMEAYPVAALYFDMIVKNYPDLSVQGNSIHLVCLKQLINLVDNPLQQEWYYEELISRFLDQIDPGPSYFMLGQAYEGTGDWTNAIKAYTQYLPYAGSDVPGFPNADSYAKQLVDFNNSAKDWSFENLNALVKAVKDALDSGASGRLWNYHAKANFFTRTWEHEDTSDGAIAGHAVFNLSEFMRGNRIRYADSLDVSSNANEAYLRTWGWSQYISTWYLYFRKIHFPLDPEMHGRWEWAGIYYGEKF